MKFGITMVLSVAAPYELNEHRTYMEALEQVRLADELGFAQLWAVEHHFLEGYSHLSSPEIFLTAAAMQTKQIQLCHGIVVCVPQFVHPVKVAERTATLDIVSGGRVQLGTGRSSTWTELAGFGGNPDDTKKTWDEFVRAIPKMWMQERYSHQGRAFSMPERAILPKPLQKPHPPLWVAVTSPGTEIDAADRGLGSMGLSFGGYQQQEKVINEYRRRIRLCEPVGAFVNEQVNTTNFLFCHESLDYAAEAGRRLAEGYRYSAAQNVFIREVYPSRGYPSHGLMPALRKELAGPGDKSGLPEGIAIGDPQRIIRVLKSWEGVGVDCVNMILSAADAVTHEEIMTSLRLFAREVMPVFAATPSVGSKGQSAPMRESA
jgi:alkanesulfonate monooxygenase SsuD/methylene tetrahydromethanopterin reductase-like flavin-dependent oxidoreductase (luciferase family)